MKLKVKNLSEFAKNIATIMTGSAIAQVLVLLLTPILTRIYSPSVFGSVAVFTAIHSIIAVSSTLFYSQAIMVDNMEEDAKGTAIISVISSLLIGSITGIGCLIYAVNFETNSLVNLFLILLPIEVFLSGVRDTTNMWNTRNKKYKELSIVMIVFSVSHTLFSIIFGLLGMGSKGLILGKFIAILLNSSLLLIVMIRRTNFKKIRTSINVMKTVALKHKAYPIYNMPSQFLNTSSIQLPILMFSSFYGSFETGGYTKATSLIQLPLSLVGNAVSTVFFQQASKFNSEENFDALYKLTLSTYKRLLLISIPALIALVGFGDLLFSFVLGVDWLESGKYASILAPWFIFSFVTSPLSTVLFIKNKHKQNFIINLILIMTRVGVVLIFGKLGFVFKNILFISSFSGILIWAGFNAYILKLVGIRFKDSVLPALSVISGSIILGILFRKAINLMFLF